MQEPRPGRPREYVEQVHDERARRDGSLEALRLERGELEVRVCQCGRPFTTGPRSNRKWCSEECRLRHAAAARRARFVAALDELLELTTGRSHELAAMLRRWLAP